MALSFGSFDSFRLRGHDEESRHVPDVVGGVGKMLKLFALWLSHHGASEEDVLGPDLVTSWKT